MPVYEFRCDDCGAKFELVATLAERDSGLEPECPKCGSSNCEQVFGRVNVMTSSKSDRDLDDFDTEDDFGDSSDSDVDDSFDDSELEGLD